MKLVRKKIIVQGIVQGVGFRPFIYNLAESFNISGFVSNTSQGVIIEAESELNIIDSFIDEITAKSPPLAVITNVNSAEIRVQNSSDFVIKKSDSVDSISTLISPDIAVCDDCLEELLDPNDRRYLYPFINCTNCGPRYTIIDNIPYDRPYTSMKDFKMCPECQSEYDDPSNRRFHAQPNACPNCGPQIKLFDSNQNNLNTDEIITTACELLKQGNIIAIKGLGGFHLAVDATNSDAVLKLRKLKGRDEKPFAIMVKNITKVERYCQINNTETAVLKSITSPIVLLKRME